jgi:hypothetical protein
VPALRAATGAHILLQCAKADAADSGSSEVSPAEITAVQQTRMIYNGAAFTSP